MRQTAYAKRKKFINLKGFWQLVCSHKIAISTAVLVALAASGWLIYVQAQNSNKFSKADFERLIGMAEKAVQEIPSSQRYENKTCSYEKQEELGFLHLYCTIELVSFSPYKDKIDAAKKASLLEQGIRKVFGQQSLSLSDFGNKSTNLYSDEAVSLGDMLHDAVCNFYFETNQYAQKPAQFLQAKTDKNLIAIYFECKAESQGEYFPVTYRQGT